MVTHIHNTVNSYFIKHVESFKAVIFVKIDNIFVPTHQAAVIYVKSSIRRFGLNNGGHSSVVKLQCRCFITHLSPTEGESNLCLKNVYLTIQISV